MFYTDVSKYALGGVLMREKDVYGEASLEKEKKW